MSKGGLIGKIVGGLEIIAGIAAIIISGGTLTPLAAGLIASGVTTLGASFMPSPKAPDFQQQSQANRQTFRSTVTPHKIVYGAERISGPIYQLGSTGAKNQFLHIIIPLAGHELESIGNVLVNDILVDGVKADKKWAAYVRVNRHLGGAGQAADADLIAELKDGTGNLIWTAHHVGAGIAYIYIRLKYNKALFPSGLRNIQADVLGKKVLDPRNQTVAWTDNWALCMRDYMSDAMGLGLTDAEIDDNYIINAANISEEIVPTVGGSENRYTMNGTINTANRPTDVIKAMLTAGAGHLVPLVEGKAVLIPGAYVTPTITLTEADLRGAVKYQAKANRKSLFNVVSGKYAGEETNWKLLTYPQIGDQAAINSDGQIIKREIALPFCTDHERCQRISKQVLNLHRASATLSMPCKLTALEVTTMDTVMVTLPALGFVNKTFRVMSWLMTPDMGIDLQLKEDAASLYAWSINDVIPFIPIPPIVPHTGGGGGIQPGIPVRVHGLELAGQGLNTVFTGGDAHFVWRHITALDFQEIGSEIFGAGAGGFDAWFMGYDITMKDAAGNELFTAFTQNNFFDFTFLKNAYLTGGPFRAFTVEVRIKGQHNQLSQSATLSVSNPAPALPTGLSLVPGFQEVFVNFTAPADLDYVGSEVYLSTASGFTPSAANLVYDGPDTTITIGSLATGTTYYARFRPYDKFGKTGLNESSELAATTQAISGADTDTTPPTIPVTNPMTTGVNESALVVTSWAKVTWSASTDNGILAGYFVEHWDSIDATKRSVFTTSLEQVLVPVNPGRTIFSRVRAQDWASNLSAWSATRQIMAAGDTTAPPMPTGFAAVLGLDKIIYSWINPTAPNFLEVRVYVGTTPGFVKDAASLAYEGRGNTFILDAGGSGSSFYAAISSVSVSGTQSAVSAESGPSVALKMGSGTLFKYMDALAIGDAFIQNLDAAKILTGFLAAARIAAGSITADKLNVTTLSAIVADLGTVTAGSLIGTQIATAASGARVTLNGANGLTVTNASGNTTANLRVDGSGFLGLGGAIQWDTNGLVTVPAQLVVGDIVGNIIRTALTGWRVEMGPVLYNGVTYLLRIHNGAGTSTFSIDSAGNAKFSGDISGSNGAFSGDISAATGHFTGLIDVPALSVGTAQIQDLAVSTLKIGNNAATTLVSSFSASTTTAVVITLSHTSDVLVMGTTFLQTTQWTWLKHSSDGGSTWTTLRSASIGAGSTTLMATITALPGSHRFLMFGSTETTVAAFASTK